MPLCYLFSTRGPRATYRAPEYNVPPFWRIGQAGHFYLLIGRKTQTWYTPVGRRDLAFCQVSLNLVQQFQRRSPKHLRQSEAGWPSWFFFRSAKKKKKKKTTHTHTNLVQDVEMLLPVKFRSIWLRGFRGKVENVLAIRGQGGHLVIPIDP